MRSPLVIVLAAVSLIGVATIGGTLFVSASTSIDQLGSDIDGEAASDQSGYSVSLSSDGTIVAIGAQDNDGNGSDSGHVRIYEWNGSAWTQKGADIDGEAALDKSGYSVSLSSDGTIVAIGAHLNDGTANSAGHVRVYEWNSGTSSWDQKGADIDGEAEGDSSGYSVSLSSDGNEIAIGAPYNDGNGSGAGHVRVYEWNSGTSSWDQKGADIDGEAAADFSGYSVSLSSDGNEIAIGGTGYIAIGAGHVRVYEWNSGTSSWDQKGADIDGEAAGDSSGYSVSLSSDGTEVAIGAPYNDGTGANAGHVRVYEWNSGTSSWDQKGADIDGEAASDQSGRSVSLSSDGTKVAIGAQLNDGTGDNAGHVRVYEWNGSAWTQTGADIDGEARLNYSGTSLSLSSDGSEVAIGAPVNSGAAYAAGHVRVYSITTSTPTTTTTTTTSTTTTTISTPSASSPSVPGQVPPWPVAILNVDGTVTVSWQAPFDDGNGPITGYRVASSPSGGSCSTTGLTCVIAGLDPDVDYLFEVFASNSDGEGPGRLTQQSIRIVPQTPATTEPAAPQLLPVTPAAPQPLPETGTDDDLVMWSILLIAFGALSVLYTRRKRLN